MSALTELGGPVNGLFTDLDGTITSDGSLHEQTLKSLFRLFNADIPVVLVTGRPAGWGHTLASLLPFAAVIAENGGVSFVPDGKRFRKIYGVSGDELPGWRKRMHAAASEVQAQNDAARLSLDSAYREVDLAIDWNEEVKLPVALANSIVAKLRADGFAASRSSIHVNYGPDSFDKFSASRRILAEVFGLADGGDLDLASYVFLGDSLNDAPMFAGFPNSVGVANVRDRWHELPHRPKYITGASEGAGFSELAEHLLALEC